MKFAKASFPKNDASTGLQVFCYSLSFLIITMVVSQLMTIEKFLPIMESYGLPGGIAMVKIFVFKLAFCGIFGLPFLFRMNLSPLFRAFSAVLLNAYGLLWVILALWVQVTNPTLLGTGTFGSVYSLPQDTLLVFSILLFGMCVFATITLRQDFQVKIK